MATTVSGARILEDHNLTTFPNSYITNNQENNNNNNYNNYIRARAREERLQKVEEAYYDVFARPMPRFVQREALAMLDRGIEADMLVAVLEYTACAPRPSWAYARAVIIRNEERGIKRGFEFMCSLSDRGRDGCEELPY